MTGATGWLGRSLLALKNRNELEINFSIFGRREEEFSLDTGHRFRTNFINIQQMVSQQFDVFAPFAFLTRDKALGMSESQYVESNKKLIEDAALVIRGGNIGSVINLSSGVVTNMSEMQKMDASYSVYADLKKFQEDTLFDACSKVSTQFINCRVFSLTGIDMQDPLKYAVGDLINQAKKTRKIILRSKSPVTRRYMDSRNLLELILLRTNMKNHQFLESGGFKIDLESLSNIILSNFGGSRNSIEYAYQSLDAGNEYFSERKDFEDIADFHGIELTSMAKQITNVEQALNRA